MSRNKQVIFLSLLASMVMGLVSCANNEQVYRGSNSGSAQSEATSADAMPTEEVSQAIETQAEIVRRDTLAREAAAKAEAAEREAAALEQQRVAQQRRAEERQAQQLLETQRLAQEEAQKAQQAQALANQQAKVEELRVQIANNNTEAQKLEASNESLREAVNLAQELSTALGAEQLKYSEIDPSTGETLEGLASSTLSELNAEVERLKAQAQSLQSASQ